MMSWLNFTFIQSYLVGYYMLDQVEKFFTDISWATAALAVIVAWYIYRHGLPWVVAKTKSIFSTAKADLSNFHALLHTSVEDVHLRVDAIQDRVIALEEQVAKVVPSVDVLNKQVNGTPAVSTATVSDTGPATGAV